jgi:undecaprenyl-diphosphatase
MKTTDALAMGGMQAVALFPGISRSGSTIAGGLFAGLDRQLAARFAFLMSVPAILGSLLFKFKDLLAGAEAMGWAPLVTGAVIAAVSGYLAIKYMLYLVRNKKLYGFAVYVAVLGALVLLDQFVFNIVFSNPFA